MKAKLFNLFPEDDPDQELNDFLIDKKNVSIVPLGLAFYGNEGDKQTYYPIIVLYED